MMEAVFIESSVRATLVAAGTALVIAALRIRMAAVLHRLWTGVLIVMLALPVWSLWGRDIPLPVLPADSASRGVVPWLAETPTAEMAAVAPTTHVLPPQPSANHPSPNAIGWRTVAMWIYVLVTCALFVRLASGMLRARRLVRLSVVNAGRLTSAACASPLTVGWSRPVVILPESWCEWSDARLDAVLTHEQEHAAQRHPLVQWLALVNRAVFWFHPLSWWLERRLAVLAEETCDDAVLARGHDAGEYAGYLLETARDVAQAGRVQLAGAFMPGTYLSQRLQRMLAQPPKRTASRARVTCAAGACAFAALVSATATPIRAVAQGAAGTERMIFRPLQPRWMDPESTRPQPMSLEWLSGDEWAFQVQSIITDDELLAYSRLQTPQQRDAFIARFWADRDPSPRTPENEFQDEYTRRVRFASERFTASGQAGFGFDSDRGRIYLMFGPPDTIDTQGGGLSRAEIWRYTSVAGIGADFHVRFSPTRGDYCGLRIVSPAPLVTNEGVQLYPFGLTTISIPVDTENIVGVRYELRNDNGVVVDQGQIGSIDDRSGEPLSTHLPAGWLSAGLGCTHALPAGRYALSSTVRPTIGDIARRTITFDVE